MDLAKLLKYNSLKFLKNQIILEFILRNFKMIFKKKHFSKIKQNRKLVKKSMIYLQVNKYQTKKDKNMFNF